MERACISNVCSTMGHCYVGRLHYNSASIANSRGPPACTRRKCDTTQNIVEDSKTSKNVILRGCLTVRVREPESEPEPGWWFRFFFCCRYVGEGERASLADTIPRNQSG